MPKKAEGEETVVTDVETLPETPPEEPKTPTAEEQLATLQQELKETQTRLEQTDKGLRTAHGTITEKDRLLKEQSDLNSRIDGMEETQRILAAMLAERGAVDEEVDPTKRDKYLNQFDEIAKRQKQERELAQQKARQDEYAKRHELSTQGRRKFSRIIQMNWKE